jgi:hypothetical protein
VLGRGYHRDADQAARPGRGCHVEARSPTPRDTHFCPLFRPCGGLTPVPSTPAWATQSVCSATVMVRPPADTGVTTVFHRNKHATVPHSQPHPANVLPHAPSRSPIRSPQTSVTWPSRSLPTHVPDHSRLMWRPTEEMPSIRASPIVSSAEHRAAEGAEHSQDRPYDEQKDPDNPQYRAMDQKPHNQQNNTKSDHNLYDTTHTSTHRQFIDTQSSQTTTPRTLAATTPQASRTAGTGANPDTANEMRCGTPSPRASTNPPSSPRCSSGLRLLARHHPRTIGAACPDSGGSAGSGHAAQVRHRPSGARQPARADGPRPARHAGQTYNAGPRSSGDRASVS